MAVILQMTFLDSFSRVPSSPDIREKAGKYKKVLPGLRKVKEFDQFA